MVVFAVSDLGFAGIEYLIGAFYAFLASVVITPIVIAVYLEWRRTRPKCRACRTPVRRVDRYCGYCGAAVSYGWWE
jgi:hypothetical protein